ncbi:unnamed protein product [Parajaminaea phylloscopi]
MGKPNLIAIQPRRVAVCIAYIHPSAATPARVCLVSSRKHDGRWVLPKGGIEAWDADVAGAALRELWEEAGIRTPSSAQTTVSSVDVADHKPHKKSPSADKKSGSFVPRAIYTAVEVPISEEDALADWPEQAERQRRFVPVEEALELINWRRDIYEMLKASSIAR